MMLADDDIQIDDHFFDEFTSDLSDADISMNTEEVALPMPGQKRDFSSFLTPWDPSQNQPESADLDLQQPHSQTHYLGYEPCCFVECNDNNNTSSPNTTDPMESSTSECSSVCGSRSDEVGKMKGKMKSRLEKNRESATKCRLKKKNELNGLTVKITTLVNKVSLLTQENSALRADNASLTDHNRFLRGLISSQSPELPLHAISVKNESNQAAGAASGIAILGIFGAFTMLSRHGSGFFNEAGGGGSMGRVLENPLEDLLQQQSSSQLHVFVVGIFLCLLLYAAVSFGFVEKCATMEKKGLLPSYNTRKKQ